MDDQNREQFEIIEAKKRLLSELKDGKKSGEENGWISSEKVREYFRTKEK
ncbi:MAG: hypothetical protein IJ192_07290 [Clostridia bacterium]|nr:hypothetical protein [Clostridia bacterium]